MARTYAISDVHGRLDLLKSALELIHEDGRGHDCTLVVCGDMVDRGPDSAGVIQLLRQGPTESRWRWHVLYGNHEDMMVAFVDRKAYEVWIEHGGYECLLSYGYDPARPHLWDSRRMTDDARWLRKLPLVHLDPYRAFVHAGFNSNKHHKLDAQQMIWSKALDHEDRRFQGRYVVHGHVPHKSGPVIGRNKINIDTKAFNTGRLAIAVFEDNIPGPPVEILEVTSYNPGWKPDRNAIQSAADWLDNGLFRNR